MPLRPLIINEPIRSAIRALREKASANPTPLGRIKELAARGLDPADSLYPFADQTLDLPFGYRVTYTVDQQPTAFCRHLSVSVAQRGKVPSIEAVRMLAQEFGFLNELEHCVIFTETFDPGHRAINIVEPLSGRMADIAKKTKSEHAV
jgi:hypothetical protein